MSQNPTIAEVLARAGSANVQAALSELGVWAVVLQGLRRQAGRTGPFAGPARTLRYLPRREDVPGGPNGPVARSIVEALDVGEVLVVDALGCRDVAVLGDMMAARAAYRGAVGVVVDGAVRDTAGLDGIGLPVHARGTHPAPPATRLTAWEADTAVQCGGCLVRPGDWMVADADGVVVVPAERVSEVATRATELTDRDEFSQKLLGLGHALDEAYPLPPQQLDAYARFRETGVVPPPAAEAEVGAAGHDV